MTTAERRRLEACRELVPAYRGDDGRDLLKACLIEGGWITTSTTELSPAAAAQICGYLERGERIPARTHRSDRANPSDATAAPTTAELVTVRDLIAYYFAAWSRARREHPALLLPEKPPPATANHCKNMRIMIAQVGAEAVARGIDTLVTTHDRWIATESDRSLGVLYHCRQRLITEYEEERQTNAKRVSADIHSRVTNHLRVLRGGPRPDTQPGGPIPGGGGGHPPATRIRGGHLLPVP